MYNRKKSWIASDKFTAEQFCTIRIAYFLFVSLCFEFDPSLEINLYNYIFCFLDLLFGLLSDLFDLQLDLPYIDLLYTLAYILALAINLS
jgi:hypothetical protein